MFPSYSTPGATGALAQLAELARQAEEAERRSQEEASPLLVQLRDASTKRTDVNPLLQAFEKVRSGALTPEAPPAAPPPNPADQQLEALFGSLMKKQNVSQEEILRQQEEYADRRFQERFSGKSGTARAFLTDLVRGWKGQGSIRDALRESALKDWNTAFEKNRQNDAQLLQMVQQKMTERRTEQQRQLENAKLEELRRRTNVNLMLGSMREMTKLKGIESADLDRQRDALAETYRLTYGDTPDEIVMNDLVRKGAQPLEALELIAMARGIARGPQRLGTSRISRVAFNDKGEPIETQSQTQNIYAPQTNAPYLQRLRERFLGPGATAPGAPPTPSPSPGAPAPTAPTRPSAPGPIAQVTPARDDQVSFYRAPGSVGATQKEIAGLTVAKQKGQAVTYDLMNAGLEIGPDGRPKAAHFTGPVKGSGFAQTLRRSWPEIAERLGLKYSNWEALTVPQLAQALFQMTKSDVGGRIAVQEFQYHANFFPGVNQDYQELMKLSIAMTLNAQASLDERNPALRRKLPASEQHDWSPAARQKFGAEIDRVMWEMGQLTKGFTFKNMTDEDKRRLQSAIDSGRLKIRSTAEILSQPRWVQPTARVKSVTTGKQ